jgi:hypothetical protein
VEAAFRPLACRAGGREGPPPCKAGLSRLSTSLLRHRTGLQIRIQQGHARSSCSCLIGTSLQRDRLSYNYARTTHRFSLSQSSAEEQVGAAQAQHSASSLALSLQQARKTLLARSVTADVSINLSGRCRRGVQPQQVLSLSLSNSVLT